MAAWLKHTYNRVFLGFIASIFILLPFVSETGKPNAKFIMADGLGYYAYLPAQFIYHDTDFEFKWFNEAYYKHYNFDAFDVNNRNFFVPYKDRTINKYYQGMSLLWMPFFLPAHLYARLSHQPADGFSEPYQYSVIIAALFYVIIGLIFLRRLIRNLFHNEWIAVIIPIIFFFGTHLFYYTYWLCSHSHVYSFALIIMFLYFAQSFFNEKENRWANGLWCLFCLFMTISVRPLNMMIVLTVPAFMPKDFFKQRLKLGKLQVKHLVIAALTLGAVIYHYSILYKQTGTFFPYTYTNERFYFSQPKLFDVLFSYHAGMFLYIPLMIVAVAGIFYMPLTRQKILLPLTFFIVIYLYAAWWYWPIISRTLIDFYVIPAILVAALLAKMNVTVARRRAALTLVFICVAFYQFKSMQFYRGILDPNYTYGELYWHNFFRWHKARVYAIPPQVVIKEKVYTQDFDNGTYDGNLSDKKTFSGKYAAILNDHADYTKTFTYKIPDFFKEKGLKRIRFSFRSFYGGDIQSVQMAINTYDKDEKQLSMTPFYIQGDNIRYNSWDLEQYGREITDEEIAAGLDHVSIYFWNSEMKNEMFIDDVKTEFVLTDRSYEIVQEGK